MFKVFEFAKNQKNPRFMMERINDFLRKHDFVFVTQNENQRTGRIVLSILANELEEGEQSAVRCEIFRTNSSRILEDEINKFTSQDKICEEVTMITQTFSSNTVMSMLFFEKGSEYQEIQPDTEQVAEEDMPVMTDTPEETDDNEEEAEFIDGGDSVETSDEDSEIVEEGETVVAEDSQEDSEESQG